MTDEYKNQAILARRIAGEIAKVAKTHAQAYAIISLIEKQFKQSEIKLLKCAVGTTGDKLEMPQAEAGGITQ